MDTKLKNNNKLRVLLSVVILLVITMVNVFFFPVIGEKAEANYAKDASDYKEINDEVFESLYQGALVMYYEQTTKTAEEFVEPLDVFVNMELVTDEEAKHSLEENFDYVYELMEREFASYRYLVDYYATNGAMSESNMAESLTGVLEGTTSIDEELLKKYQNMWMMSFDELGQMHIEVIKSEDITPDRLVKTFKQIEGLYNISERIRNHTGIDSPNMIVNQVKDFQVLYGISYEQAEYASLSEDWYYYSEINEHYSNQAFPLYLVSIVIIAVAAFLMTSPKIWKENNLKRKKRIYVFEPAIFGTLMIAHWFHIYFSSIYQVRIRGLERIDYAIASLSGEIFRYADIIGSVLFSFAMSYFIFVAFCPVLTLGVKEYIKEYSFVYQLFPRLKKYWNKLKEEVEHIDFSDETRKTIIKLLVGNFVILAAITCLWFFGIAGLVIYSMILYFVIDNYYTRLQNDYQTLLKATSRIAEGDLDTVISDDIGVFEPMKAELTKIRTGFKKAVDEEVKSQRMKTELITNVSHDLKTPLTAITTYVELLKKDDITDEERKEYIETLERKSLRLKVLIEDLFEVSKASSNNITLNLMKVDLVKLMKQVAIEHSEKYDEANIELCWKVPEEKVELMLDSQKTYRIFENLFVNIQKYAMKGSRVYIDIADADGQVKVTMKNMSAAPLNVAPEELTERFVRGDASRNTEGSGLGLAIAKSFTEAQKGSFEIVVDGDLFKTVIIWSK